MPLDVAVNTYTNTGLIPYMDAEDALEYPVNIPVSTTINQGTILGQVTAAANDVQTVTVTGTPTGGTFTLTFNGQTTATIAYNAIATAVATAVAALGNVGAGNVAGTGGPLPGTPVVLTFGGALANMPQPVMTATGAFTGGTTPAVTVAHTTTGSTAGTFASYASGNSDGTQTPRAIMRYTVTSDASGNISMGSVAGGEWGNYRRNATAYFAGTFRTTDLAGLDATALTNSPSWRLVSGSVANGVLRLG